MTTRRVLEIGDPLLRRKAAEIEAEVLGTPRLRALVDDMIDAMRVNGGIGIAAPQIGESVRTVVIEIVPESRRYPDMRPFPLAVFVNPRVTVLDPTPQSFWEGCLSVPGLRGLVARPRGVRVSYVDLEGVERTIETDGFLATVLQHEIDHLDGILFVDRLTDTRQLATVENYVRFWRDSAPAGAEI